MKVIACLSSKGALVEMDVNRMNRLARISRITLGTAQLGMRYGIASSGEPDIGRSHAVLDAAWDAGITSIDTARVYGEAEKRLGDWLTKRKTDPFLISKLPPLDDPRAEAVEDAFAQSTAALHVAHIDAYLCHRAADLKQSAVRTGFDKLLADKRIGGFGVSVYSPSELKAAMRIGSISFVQLPLSLANFRFAHEGAIAEAAQRGVLVFARSIYLQGILLSSPERLPSWLSPLVEPLRRLRALASETSTSVAALAFAAVDAIPGIHSIVVGAESPTQLAQSVAVWRAAPPDAPVIERALSLFEQVPAELTDPSRWPAS
jgi:aryl-alcohol dehydrogenase-like predicted oxidoreductase